MSKYSGIQDFKDILDEKFKDFNEFMDATQGVIYQWDEYNQLVMRFITDPIDLVKYYSCKVANIYEGNNEFNIHLDNPTKIQKWFEKTLSKKCNFNEADIEYIIEQSKNPNSGYNQNDPKLAGAYMILFITKPQNRYII